MEFAMSLSEEFREMTDTDQPMNFWFYNYTNVYLLCFF